MPFFPFGLWPLASGAGMGSSVLTLACTSGLGGSRSRKRTGDTQTGKVVGQPTHEAVEMDLSASHQLQPSKHSQIVHFGNGCFCPVAITVPGL